MYPITPTPTDDYAKINGEIYYTYSGVSAISRSKAAGSFKRCRSEASDHRTIYSPIEGENVARTCSMPQRPDKTAVKKNLSPDGPRSEGVDCSTRGEKHTIPKADNARNYELSFTKLRAEETQTSSKLIGELLQKFSTERESLYVSTGEDRLFKLK